jgi:asparagine synthase (glutamine-hydrolysing)
LDEPFGDASIIPTYLLSRFTRREVKVSLSGDGGDELFAGYPTYQAHRIATLYEKIPHTIHRGIKAVIDRLPTSTSNISLDFRAKRFLSGIGLPPEIRNFIWLGSFRPDELRNLLNPDIYRFIEEDDPFMDVIDHLRACSPDDPIEKILSLDMRFYLQDDMLVKVDRASMANSLESRVPFLDHTLVEFVASLPRDLKLRGLTTKYILKRTMKGRLPRKIIQRKKKGFGIPVARWIKKELKDFVLDVFNREKIRRESIFNPQAIDVILKDHFDGKKDNRKLIWTLLIFELWYQRYGSGGI